MSRYIDAEWLMNFFVDIPNNFTLTIGNLRAMVNDAPSINIVRCKECKYASDNKVYGCMLNHFNDNDYDYHRMYADDFCSYGEREGEWILDKTTKSRAKGADDEN